MTKLDRAHPPHLQNGRGAAKKSQGGGTSIETGRTSPHVGGHGESAFGGKFGRRRRPKVNTEQP